MIYLNEVAEILAIGILRLKIREYENRRKAMENRENSLDSITIKSVHGDKFYNGVFDESDCPKTNYRT